VRADANKAFDMARNIRGGMPKQTPEGYNRPIDGQPDPWSPFDPKFGGFWEGGTHWSEVVRDDAIEFMGHAKKSGNPFFMYIAFNAVHDPRQAPKEYIDRYPLSRIKMPENWLPEYPYKDDIGCSARMRDEKLAPFPRTENTIKVNRQEYYAIAEHMDEQIGRVLENLEKSGMADNTYIFFTADHGLGVGHHGLLGKQNLYDHSVRVPFIAVGPGIAKNKKISTPIYLQDVMPTTLDLAGVAKPDHVEFQNLMPLLRGEKKKSDYKAIYGAYLQVQRSIIVGKHKLILYPKAEKARLYDLKKDPQEMKDLIDEKKSQKVAKRLFAKLLKMQKENDDSLDLKAAFPDL
jgi:choline-sulfatase